MTKLKLAPTKPIHLKLAPTKPIHLKLAPTKPIHECFNGWLVVDVDF